MKMSCGGCLGILILYCALFAGLGAWVVPYTMNFWLVFAEKDPVFTWQAGALIGLIPGLGQVIVVCGLITYFASFFMV